MLNGNVDDKKEVKYDVNKSAFFQESTALTKKLLRALKWVNRKKN